MIFPNCEKLGQTIIFVRTREAARTLHSRMEAEGYKCTSITVRGAAARLLSALKRVDAHAAASQCMHAAARGMPILLSPAPCPSRPPLSDPHSAVFCLGALLPQL